MHIKRYSPTKNSAGFTIVELLIATAVFSLVLILITTGVLRFTREYYKGVISGKTQDAARAVVDDITRSIQFNGGDVATILVKPAKPLNKDTNPAIAYCFGEAKRYSFYLNSQVTDGTPIAAQNQARQALVVEQVSGCNANSGALNVKNSATLPANARELLGSHMRLVKFDVTGGGDLWTIDVKVIYGDDQLLCTTRTTAPSSAQCKNKNAPVGLPALNAAERESLTCRTNEGSQFCAVSELTTTVDKRVKRVN